MTSTTNTCVSTVRKERIIINHRTQAQERPRFSSRGKSVHAYDAIKSRNYKEIVGYETRKQMSNPFDVPISVRIAVFREIPKSWSQKKKQQAIDGEILPRTSPDLDNYVKSILDGMNKIAFIDDNLVCNIHAYKRYGEPRAEIEITEIIKGKLR